MRARTDKLADEVVQQPHADHFRPKVAIIAQRLHDRIPPRELMGAAFRSGARDAPAEGPSAADAGGTRGHHRVHHGQLDPPLHHVLCPGLQVRV